MKTKDALYQAVKFVKGGNFVTVEETGKLNSEEIIQLIHYLTDDLHIKKLKYLTILLSDPVAQEVESHLRLHAFHFYDEIVFFRRDLTRLTYGSPFKLKSLEEISKQDFRKIWGRSMQGSLNAPPSLDMDEQMKSVEKELGPSYMETCNIACEEEKPIGVVMPHIEPGTKEEGRIFYFGLIPEARGLKKALPLYKQGLQLLKDHFGASYSVGATSVNNVPMRRVFEQAGCEKTANIKVYKRVF